MSSDGERSYSWDAENRLIKIRYASQPDKETQFAYDGVGRRVKASLTPSQGATPTNINYMWCGDALCQSRDQAYSATRSYFDEGEYRVGVSNPSLYYGIDQLGSVRRVFESATSAPKYDYDPWGNRAQTSKIVDFGFAGMLAAEDAGLDLTWYRAYDHATGRWISRDPLGETTDPVANLFAYVANSPPNYVDPQGLQFKCEGACKDGGGPAAKDWGDRGATAGYCVGGVNLCRNCAVKTLGIDGMSGGQQIKILSPFTR